MGRVVLGISPEAWPAWRDLTAALNAMPTAPACAANPDEWFRGRELIRAEAAESCTWCPAADACRAFAIANNEPAGVWAGLDRAGTKAGGQL